jgi:hypothetical protein
MKIMTQLYYIYYHTVHERSQLIRYNLIYKAVPNVKTR